jgi:superfamily II DNA or RNA helicase
VHEATLSFDRGTLRINGRGLPGAVWDDRIRAWRLSAHRYASALDASRGASIAIRDTVRVLDAPPVRGWSVPTLRPYQEAAVRAWTALGRRGIVVLPTGAGKTRLAIAAIAELGLRTLILVPTRALLEQWEQELARFYDGLIGVVGDGACRLTSVTIMTFESAYRRLDDFGGSFGMLVVDEAHHFGTGIRSEALEMCVAPIRLGLTATAPSGGSAAEARLSDLIGPIAYEVLLGELVGTHLAELEIVTLRVPLEDDEAREYERLARPFLELRGTLLRAHPGADWASCMRLIVEQGGRKAIGAFHEACALAAFPRRKAALLGRLLTEHRADQTLVFTARADDAYAISEAHLIPVVTSETARAERKEILARFADGRYRALVSARVLNEGVDVPEARVAVIVSGALGLREHVQRIGRVLRPRDGKRALVYELVTSGTIEEDRSRAKRRHLAARIAPRV